MPEFRQPASTEWCLIWVFGLGMIWPIYNGVAWANFKIIAFCALIVVPLSISWLLTVRKVVFDGQTLRVYLRSGWRRQFLVAEVAGMTAISRPVYPGMSLMIKLKTGRTRSYLLLGPEAPEFISQITPYFSPLVWCLNIKNRTVTVFSFWQCRQQL